MNSGGINVCECREINMCLITGNNLFNQWCTNEVILTQFRDIPLPSVTTTTEGSGKYNIEIVEIHWAYNIYKTKDSFYLSGIWGGRKQFTKITLPKECNISENSVLITGNDYRLMFVEKYMGKLWIIDENDDAKEIKFSEAPVDFSSKKKKGNSEIKKVKATGDNLLCLTCSGNLYIGMLPGLVNTDHCLGTICDIDCGFEHFVLLTDAGTVYTWGNGRRLQLGHGDLDNLEIPTEVEALAGIRIVKICAGGWHTAALSEFGDLYVWGWNDMGQLGIRTNKENEHMTESESDISSSTLPTLVDLYGNNKEIVNLNVKDVACGSRHTAIILEDNSVWTSGCNKYGQLGFEPNLYSTVSHFKKAYESNVDAKLLCGPWTTVLENR